VHSTNVQYTHNVQTLQSGRAATTGSHKSLPFRKKILNPGLEKDL